LKEVKSSYVAKLGGDDELDAADCSIRREEVVLIWEIKITREGAVGGALIQLIGDRVNKCQV
jgi:hypothetical protein